MKIASSISEIELTEDQKSALEKLEEFLVGGKGVFMLKGYAGTGKTTILKGLTRHLRTLEKPFVLTAPTGRAAKILRDHTGEGAFTIHKSIYSYEDLIEVQSEESFYYYYGLKNNRDIINTIFIIDEASMVSDAKSEGEFFRFGSGHLLSDLITFSRANDEASNNKLIFVGDPAQLPPIGDSHSKAFDPIFLKDKFRLQCDGVELKEVKRQTEHSGILNAATKLRKCISSGFYNYFSIESNGQDIHVVPAESFLAEYFNASGRKIIIAYKNKTCLHFNVQIRSQKFGKNISPLQDGEIVIVGANNRTKGILNGEFAVVTFVGDTIERTVALKGKKPVDLIWRTVKLTFPETDNEAKAVTGYALVNFITGDTHLSPDEMQALYVDFKNRHPNLRPQTEEFKKAISNDEYFNCILLKYGYAVTCHKAQGGEWDSVFIVWDYQHQANETLASTANGSKSINNETFFRWAYTAVTRASKHLLSLNPPNFNSYSALSIIQETASRTLAELTGLPPKKECEAHLDSNLLELLEKHGLTNEVIPVQDHFINVFTQAQQKYIDILSWRRHGFEIWYAFQREDQTACIKTWINKNGVFNSKYEQVPSFTNSLELCKELEIILKTLPNFHVLRTSAETILKRIEFDLATEEKLPFTKCLFDDLERLLEGTKISVADLQHLPYRERYTFTRASESAVLDFEYNGKGFFGKVLEVPNKQNSQHLLADLYSIVMSLQTEDHASNGN